jgi:DNA-binding XRE family transcriptional regulator
LGAEAPLDLNQGITLHQKVHFGLFGVGNNYQWVLSSIHDTRYQVLQTQMIKLRKKASLTQKELGQLLGCGQSFVSKVERGEAYVDLLMFIDWSRACGEAPEVSLQSYLQSTN